jgi:hypothetical protein
MSLYSQDDERAIRVQRLVEDWTKSGLLLPEQRERMLPELQVDLRRTNKFIRITLFLFGFLIVNAATALISLFFDFDNEAFSWVALIASAGCFAGARSLIRRYRLYHFGIEESVAIAAVSFGVIFAATAFVSGFSTASAFAAAAIGGALLFTQFGYFYGGVAAVVFVPFVVFDIAQTDTVRRLVAFIVLLTIFFLARERREDHDPDHPADAYGLFEGVAWAAMYLIANLKLSPWLSIPDEVPAFYWGTYVAIWLLPIAGLWIAVRDRHRAMLDVNIVLAIVTLMSNKPYLGAEQNAWDPIVFGVVLMGIAVGLRRWLASGPDGARSGFTAERILASEQERVALAGSVTVFAPGAPAQTTHESPGIGGGGESGGAGASGRF